MTEKEILTRECVEELVSGLSWKFSEGAMNSEDWQKVESFLTWVKVKYPDIAAENSYLFK